MEENGNNTNFAKNTKQKIAKPYLNKPVNCPWTSRAPLSSSSNFKNGGIFTENNKVSLDNCTIREQYNNSSASNGFTNKSIVNHQTSTQFFHFLRLMQLFPDVHPATLHTVMTLCKNDFFSTVDKLLYAKRCKDLLMKRRQFLAPNNKPKIRHQPYPCNSNFNENIKIVLNYKKNDTASNDQQSNSQHTQTNWDANFPSRSMDSKRYVYKNNSKGKDSKTDSELTPVASPQCELPIKPLSPPPPNIVQDLTKQNIIKNEVERLDL